MRPDNLLPLAALTLLTTAGLNASAGTYLDKYEATAGEVQATAVTTLDLLSLQGSVAPVVAVRFGDDREGLALLSFDSGRITISEDLAKELKLKVKKADKGSVTGEGERAQVSQISLGEVALVDVNAAVGSLGLINGLPVDAIIGLGALEDQLAWAVLPSQGVVKLGPASAGATLLSEVGGAAVTYRSVEAVIEKRKIGHVPFKRADQAAPFLVPVTLAGQSVEAALASAEGDDCTAAAAVTPADTLTVDLGDQRWVWLEASLGDGPAVGQWFLNAGRYQVQTSAPPAWRATLCADITSRFDVAIDPVNHKIGLKQVGDKAKERASADALLMARLTKATEPKAKDESKDEAKAKDDKPEKPDAGPWMTLGETALTLRQIDQAVDAYRKAAELDPKSCEAHLGLGRALLDRGSLKESRDALGRASSLSHAWWDLSRDEREEVQKSQKKLEGDALDAAEPHQQPATCTAADGLLAEAALLAGDRAALAQLYKDRLDLDPNLALAAGVGGLLEQNWQGAEASLRQALKRETLGEPDARTRLGLGLVNAAQGNWDAAAPQLGDALLLDGQDWMILHRYLDTVETFLGAEQARKIGLRWAEERPNSLAAAVEALRLAQAGGDAATIESARKHAEAVAAQPSLPIQRSVRAALKGRLALQLGDTAAAESAAREALKRDPSEPLAWLVLMDVAGTRYDDKAFLDARDHAVIGGGLHPGWALVSLATPPVPPPPPEPEPVVEEPPPEPPKKGKK